MTRPQHHELIRLARASSLSLLSAGEGLDFERTRRIRYFFKLRLLFPHFIVRVDCSARPPRVKVRPDPWAWVLLIICTFGIATELTLDRTHYPRDYPAEFVYTLSLWSVIVTTWEGYLSARAARQLRRELSAAETMASKASPSV